MADNHNRIAIRLVVSRKQGAAQNRLDSQSWKKIRSDLRGMNSFRLPFSQSQSPEYVCCDRFQSFALAPQNEKVLMQDRLLSRRRDSNDAHKPIGIRIRRSLMQKSAT